VPVPFLVGLAPADADAQPVRGLGEIRDLEGPPPE
jgi:hypothetical protein